jgi:hypothetical protein
MTSMAVDSSVVGGGMNNEDDLCNGYDGNGVGDDDDNEGFQGGVALLNISSTSSTESMEEEIISRFKTNNLKGRELFLPFHASKKPLSKRQLCGTGEQPVRDYIQDMILLEHLPKDIAVAPDDYTGPPEAWIYNQMRQVLLELHSLLIRMREVCTSETCPKMTVQDAEFVCAAHSKPRSCSAMHYSQHTLDGAISVLESPNQFTELEQVKNKGFPVFCTLSRRLYRILAHAAFHHEEVFSKYEKQMELCERFHALVLQYKLMAPGLLVIPDSMLCRRQSVP